MIWNCISAQGPDILVVDTFPSGSFDELYDVMDFGFKKAFIYRPRKDHKKLWNNPIIKAYDKILYINETHETDRLENDLLEDRIQYLEAIVQRNKIELLPRAKACQHLGLISKQKTACILAGGGGDKTNQAFFERMLRLIVAFPGIQFIIAAGPLYKGAEIHSKQARWFYQTNISLYWNAFDFVIAAGGFNSVNELLHAQIPALFFPQNRLYDDQEARINSLSEQGLCLQFSAEDSDQHIQSSIQKIANPNEQRILQKALQQHALKNDADDAALGILGLKVTEDLLQKAEDLLDLALIQRFITAGISERIICKVIRAFSLFQSRMNESENLSTHLDEDDVLIASNTFLQYLVDLNPTQNRILPLLFQSIKKEKNTTLDLLLSDIKEHIFQV